MAIQFKVCISAAPKRFHVIFFKWSRQSVLEAGGVQEILLKAGVDPQGPSKVGEGGFQCGQPRLTSGFPWYLVCSVSAEWLNFLTSPTISFLAISFLARFSCFMIQSSLTVHFISRRGNPHPCKAMGKFPSVFAL